MSNEYNGVQKWSFAAQSPSLQSSSSPFSFTFCRKIIRRYLNKRSISPRVVVLVVLVNGQCNGVRAHQPEKLPNTHPLAPELLQQASKYTSEGLKYPE